MAIAETLKNRFGDDFEKLRDAILKIGSYEPR